MTSNDVEALKEKFKEVVQGTLDITHQTQSIFKKVSHKVQSKDFATCYPKSLYLLKG